MELFERGAQAACSRPEDAGHGELVRNRVGLCNARLCLEFRLLGLFLLVRLVKDTEAVEKLGRAFV